MTSNSMKTLRLIGFALVATLLSFSITACGGDDEEENVVDNSVTNAKYTYELNVNQTFLDLADITISIVTPDGKTTKENLSTTSYNKTVNVANFPAKISAGVTYKWKDGLDVSGIESIDLMMNSTYSVAGLNSKGEIMKSQSKSGISINNGGVRKDKLNELRELHIKRLNQSNQTVTISKAGNNVDFTFEPYVFE